MFSDCLLTKKKAWNSYIVVLRNMDRVPTYPLDNIGRKLAQQLSMRGLICEFVVRAPGRVNLIGEHIDYNGYAVLPMALQQAVYVAVGPQCDGRITFTSTSPEYETANLTIDEALRFGSQGPPSTAMWFHYPLCSLRGIVDYSADNNLMWTPPSLTLLVGGPEFGGLWPAAGLSSSSALVVASAIAIMKMSGLQICRRELASLCARCEQYIGVQGGGMDQAASLLGSESGAILIEFTKPLITIRPVPLPPDIVFVIAHSGVDVHKAATQKYNERVSECRIASKLLIKNSPLSNAPDFCRPLCLVDAQNAWNFERPGCMLTQDDTGQSIVDRFLRDGVVTREELLEFISIDDFLSCLTPTTQGMQKFYPKMRAQHVFAEAERTLEFYGLCHSLGSAGDSGARLNLLSKLGNLMIESQRSCADLYNCSCSSLNELIDICRSAGATGSRLTGAGWGGCTVSLVPSSRVEDFIQQVRQAFYVKRGLVADINKLVFVSSPGSPAGIMLANSQ